ncbi:hypothetical protein PG990_012783 [Apiospora arundinis]|jgi:hypothetical protein
MSSVLAVVAVESSGGSDESEPLPVDFWGDPFFVKALVVRSARPDALEAEEECCDCGWVVRAREDRRVGEVPAICFGAAQSRVGLLAELAANELGTQGKWSLKRFRWS